MQHTSIYIICYLDTMRKATLAYIIIIPLTPDRIEKVGGLAAAGEKLPWQFRHINQSSVTTAHKRKKKN